MMKRMITCLFCALMVGCAALDKPQHLSPPVTDVAKRLRQLHKGMRRAEVEQALQPCDLLWGADISGLVAEFYLLRPDVGVWLRFDVKSMQGDSPEDLLSFAPRSITVKSGKSRHGAEWQKVSILLPD